MIMDLFIRGNRSCSEDGTTELLDEPLLGLFLGDLLEVTEGGSSCLSSGDSLAGSSEDNEEVHTIDTSGWVVLDSQVDVFIDTEAEVAYIINKIFRIRLSFTKQ